jgi:RNA polymerase sigma-70 factor (ECF subfamily)
MVDGSRGHLEFEQVFREEFAPILRTVFLIGHNHHRAEEITQDAFVQMLRHWDRVRTMDKPGAWVRRVAVRLAIKSVHREARRRNAEHALPDQVELYDGDLDVLEAVRRLPAQQRAAVVLYYFEDRPVAEIADLLGCAPATARVHIHRARGRLAFELDQEVIDRVGD